MITKLGKRKCNDSVEEECKATKKNILHDWETLRAKLADSKFAIFLDYDGTLTPIVKNPSDAIMTSDTRKVIDELSRKHDTLAIVTGRSINTIMKFVGLKNLYYAGSHGYDIRGPNNTEIKTVADSYLPALKKFCEDVSKKVSVYHGSFIENNDFSVSVHYRNVSEENRKPVEEIVDKCLENYPNLCKTFGKFVFEIRPKFDWNKGKAVRWMLDNLFKNDELIPVYIGDDVTDEDAFKELHSNKSALCIFVRSPEQDRPSAANYVLDSTEEVKTFLIKLSKL